MTNTAEVQMKPVSELIARKGNEVTGNYYLAECGGCGEMFSSERMTGGQAIADTGDYGDCYCPHCDTDDSEIIDCGAVNSAVVEAWNFQQKHIDALIAALEQAQHRNSELEVYSKTAIEFREAARDENRHLKIELRIAENRIAELESAPNGMMQLSNELAEMKPVKLPSAWVEPGNRWLQERDVIEAIRAAGGTVEGSD